MLKCRICDTQTYLSATLLPLLPATPLALSALNGFRHETRETPTNPRSAGNLGVADQVKAVGATSLRGRRLPAMHLVSIREPQLGRDPQRQLTAHAKGTPVIQKPRKGKPVIQGPAEGTPGIQNSGRMLAPALLAAV